MDLPSFFQISEYGRAKSFVTRGETRWYSHYGLFRSLLEMEMALRKFALKHYQDDGVSGSSRGDIVLENCSSNRFCINVKEVAGFLRPITI
jgi:hypothetical protein